MARLQDFQQVTPSAANDNLLIVQAAGQGLAKIDAVGQKIATDTTVSSLDTTSKKIAGAINELKGNINNVGTIINATRTATVFKRTWGSVANIVLNKGTWIIVCSILLQGDNTGYRAMNLNATAGETTPKVSANPVPGSLTSLDLTQIYIAQTDNTTLHVNGIQTSTNNSELNILTFSCQAIRIK